MKSLKFHLLLAFLLIAPTILPSYPAFSIDDDPNDDVPTNDIIDNDVSVDDGSCLVQGINSHRQALKLPLLAKNEQVQCLADKLSNQLNHKPCGVAASSVYAKAIPMSSNGEPFTNYPDILAQCNIHAPAAADGIILPVCVPELVPPLVLGNYTQTPYEKYLNDSKFTSIGVDSEEDWMVVVLSSGMPQGGTAGGGAMPRGSGTTMAQGSGAAKKGVGIGSEMMSGVYLMTLSLGVGLLLTS